MDTISDRDEALSRAIDQAGGPAALARHISTVMPERTLTTQAISQWKRCPTDRALAVESAPGVTVTRYELRPDVYGAEPANSATAREARVAP